MCSQLLNVLFCVYRRMVLGITIPITPRIHRTVFFDSAYGGSVAVGKDTVLDRGVMVAPYGGSITIGGNSYVGPYSVLYGHGGGLVIGDNCLIAAQCILTPVNHLFDRLDIPITEQKVNSTGIVLEDNVWLGAGARILDGVTLGHGCVVGSGSVVSKSFPPNSVVVGVPAKFVRERGQPKVSSDPADGGG